MAQDLQSVPETMEPVAEVAGLSPADSGGILIGTDKRAPLCPEFCAPRRVTTPEQASVGEREVLTYTLAAAATGSKLHTDSRRSLWARAEKLPGTAPLEPTPTMVTRNAFRPALDPMLVEPTTDDLE